ncbi:TPA: DoxX family protein [Candidatus Woesearchaeota archaeon]|nr:DoxX family protein [Candidatus Woesearchaeota archaeon]HIH32598.1 DoxX family protein [Candidatus Woesearchaeota archaeon]HIH54933.1 DoxX family protein [Candidatus Woesearchaeota archaeon]HIJ01775.1 DoxX family protein [Candidatus Woesearchaeota archaeon]HIJ14017.1 DoxX family protein [Candidatus Woesearchaeota archaeon]
MFEKFAKSSENTLYVIFRVVVGLLFAMHGLSKLGWIGGKEAMTGLFLVVGIGELLVGLGILTGLLTRISALGGLVIMIGAQIMSHLPKGINPMTNGGELSLLFLVSFLVVFALGAKKLSLGKALFGKELL